MVVPLCLLTLLTSDFLSNLWNNLQVPWAMGNKEEFSGDFPREMEKASLHALLWVSTIPRIPPEHRPHPLLCYFWTIQFCPRLAHHCSLQPSSYSVVQNSAVKWTPDCLSERTLALTTYYFSMSFGVSSLTQIIYQNIGCSHIWVVPLRGVLRGNV